MFARSFAASRRRKCGDCLCGASGALILNSFGTTLSLSQLIVSTLHEATNSGPGRVLQLHNRCSDLSLCVSLLTQDRGSAGVQYQLLIAATQPGTRHQSFLGRV